ncbi:MULTISPECIES: hypothetical protein [Shewanella]|uniref:Holin n=1 Tax=Shewanella mangrovisoli TaxID=2864211 RepID=A0ABV4VH19_9GAMM|nr:MULTISPECIES: hypothetical protein [Shewanella]MCU8086862.1 hypothetical protein [Shewanella sp. SM21]QYJ72436.1 hypothetical protein K0H59_05110 [Shewanella sp. FJAT-51649]GCF89244.1 hypothetical protein SMBr_14880 [Shewanella sp. M-Br]HAY93856.1 hypothetical protein [Shewanella sp.]
MNVLIKASEWKGRLIAYGGGSGISIFSSEVAAKAQEAADMAAQIPTSAFTISTLVSVGGLLVVAGRLVFDIWKYLDERQQAKKPK